MRRLRIAPWIALLGIACVVHGPSWSTFEAANVSGGGTVTVTTRPDQIGYTGELLAVEDTTLFLVCRDTLTRIPMRVVDAIRASFGAGTGIPDRGRREQLRRVARYPQGVTPELEQRLLDAYHQTAVRVVSR